MDAARTALRSALRLRGLPPRAGRGRGGGDRRRPAARRPRRHAHGSGQVAVLPAAGAHPRRPHGGRLAARVAHAGPGRGARARRPRPRRADQRPAGRRGQPRRRWRAPPRASVRLLYIAPERFSSPGFAEALRAAQRRALRRRRGALRLAVGPRLPPRLLPPRRRGALAGRAGARRLDRHRDAAGRRRHRRAPGAARPGARHHRLRSPEPVLRRRALPRRGRQARAAGRRAGAGRRAAGDRLRRHARGDRGPRRRRWRARSAPRSSPTTRAWGARSAPRPSGASWAARSRWSWPPTRSAWGSTRPTCARSRTPPCRDRSRPTTRRPAARGATGCRRARCSSPRAATRACTCSSSSARRSTTRRSRRWPARCCAPRSTAATTCRCPPRATPSPSGCAPSSATWRARAWCARRPAPIDRLRGRVLGAFDGRARATCRTSAGDAQRARWRQYRAVWAFVEGSQCRRAAILRHFGDRARAAGRRRRAATSARPSSCPPRPRRVRSARRAAAGRPRRGHRRVVTGAEPSVGRTRTVEILRGGRSQVVRKNAYDGLPALRDVRPSARGRGAGAGRRAARRGPAGLHRRRTTRSCAASARRRVRVGVLASGEGTNLQALLDTVHGREAEVVAVASDQPAARALERARGGRRAGAGVPALGVPDARGARRRHRRLAARRGRRARRARGLHGDPRRGLRRALPRPDHQRPPVAAARLPGRARRSSRRSSTG